MDIETYKEDGFLVITAIKDYRWGEFCLQIAIPEEDIGDKKITSLEVGLFGNKCQDSINVVECDKVLTFPIFKSYMEWNKEIQTTIFLQDGLASAVVYDNPHLVFMSAERRVHTPTSVDPNVREENFNQIVIYITYEKKGSEQKKKDPVVKDKVPDKKKPAPKDDKKTGPTRGSNRPDRGKWRSYRDTVRISKNRTEKV